MLRLERKRRKVTGGGRNHPRSCHIDVNMPGSEAELGSRGIGASVLLVCLFCADRPAQAQRSEIIVLTATNNPLPSLQAAADFTRNNPPLILFNEIPNFTLGEDTRAVGWRQRSR